jgi:hypothetical protein
MTTEITEADIRRYHEWLESIVFVDEFGNEVDPGMAPPDTRDEETDEELEEAQAEWLSYFGEGEDD